MEDNHVSVVTKLHVAEKK